MKRKPAIPTRVLELARIAREGLAAQGTLKSSRPEYRRSFIGIIWRTAKSEAPWLAEYEDVYFKEAGL